MIDSHIDLAVSCSGDGVVNELRPGDWEAGPPFFKKSIVTVLIRIIQGRTVLGAQIRFVKSIAYPVNLRKGSGKINSENAILFKKEYINEI